MSSQFFIEGLTKLGIFIDAYASTSEFKKMELQISNIEYTLYVYVDCTRIYSCLLVQQRYFITVKRDFAIFDVILASSYNTTSSPHSGGSMTKMISLDDDEGPIQKVPIHEIPMEYINSPFVRYLFDFEVIQRVILQ